MSQGSVWKLILTCEGEKKPLLLTLEGNWNSDKIILYLEELEIIGKFKLQLISSYP